MGGFQIASPVLDAVVRRNLRAVEKNPSLLRRLEQPQKVNWVTRAFRLGYILRYHHASQLIWRLVSLAQKRTDRVIGYRRYARVPESELEPREDVGLENGLGRVAQHKLNQRRSARFEGSGKALLAGRYRFLDVERSLPDPIDWRLESWPEVPHLWRFHLHYHEFLLDLLVEARETKEVLWIGRAWNVVFQWIDGNRLGDNGVTFDAWHPFCISRRLPVWITLWSVSPPDVSERQRVLASMFRQARYLEDHLERDLGGNHLLENARALVLMGCFFTGPSAKRWRSRGAKILQTELTEQILPHGEHFERSPGYHVEMLDALLDVRDATSAVMPGQSDQLDLADRCATTAERMAFFLREILHPDGDLPLLGDSWLVGSKSLDQQTARALPDRSEPDRAALHASHVADSRNAGDYWVYRDRDDFLLFDTGPVGPDHLPAHAHADLLSIEASLGGRRLLVDSGVFAYEDDAMRRYCRSSSAHNVLQIDGIDQCDLWSRFRMGYRGWPSVFRHGCSDGFRWARASHDAYRRLGVPRVGRWVGCRPDGPWLCIDWAEGQEQEGQDRHDLDLWLHLHPDVDIEQVADDELYLQLGDRRCKLRYLTPGQVTITEGWYCPRFGRRRLAPVLQWSTSARLPAVCGWSLTWNDRHETVRLDDSSATGVVLRWGDHRMAFDIHSS